MSELRSDRKLKQRPRFATGQPGRPSYHGVMSSRLRLERYFEFQALGANWRTEILAGFTTFMTMAYIVFVNPAILHETGMPLAAVTRRPAFRPPSAAS